MQIPAHRLPLRDYQQDIVEALNKPDIRQAVLVVARRGAKTYTVFTEHIVPQMVKEVMNVVIVYPTLAQGFKNFWNNIENDGFKTLNHFPKSLVLRQGNTEDDMRLTLINGSTLMVMGAQNAEALEENPIDSQIAALRRADRQRHNQVRLLALSLAADVLLTIGFGYVTIITNHLAKQAESNKVATFARCQATNEARAKNAKLWDYLIDQSQNQPRTPEQQKFRDDFISLKNDTFAPTDCHALKQ